MQNILYPYLYLKLQPLSGHRQHSLADKALQLSLYLNITHSNQITPLRGLTPLTLCVAVRIYYFLFLSVSELPLVDVSNRTLCFSSPSRKYI